MPSEIFDWVESLRIDIQHLHQLIDAKQKVFTVEKEAKFAELKILLNETEHVAEIPPNLMITFLLASLRHVYNADQLAKAKFLLNEMEQTITQIDNLPYSWKQ